MKNLKYLKYILIAVFVSLLALTSSARELPTNTTIHAQKPEQLWWSVNASVNVNQLQIKASVYNGLNRPIYCIGRAWGNTYYGYTPWSTMNTVINPGYTAYVYVRTSPGDPFMSGDADIQCRWN